LTVSNANTSLPLKSQAITSSGLLKKRKTYKSPEKLPDADLYQEYWGKEFDTNSKEGKPTQKTPSQSKDLEYKIV
jgi:hypothetical protein